MQDVFDPRNNGQRATIVSINRDGELRFDPSFTMFSDSGYNLIRRVATRHGIANREYEDVTDGFFIHHRIYLFHVGSISRESISRPRLSFGGLATHINERTLPGLDGESLPNHTDLAVGKPATVDDNVRGDGVPDDGSVIGGDGAVDDNVSGDGAPGDGSIIGEDRAVDDTVSGDGAEALDVSLHEGNIESEVPSLPNPVITDNDIDTDMFDVNNDHFYTVADIALIDEIANLTEATFPLGRVFGTVTKARDYALRVIGDRFGFKYSSVGFAIKCMNCEAKKTKSTTVHSIQENREQKQWRCGCLHKISTSWLHSKNRANDKRVKITRVHGQHTNGCRPSSQLLVFHNKKAGVYSIYTKTDAPIGT